MMDQRDIDPRKLIEALGSDADAIAARLLELGIKGRIDLSGKKCPLARYLRLEGCDRPTVSNFSVQWADVYRQSLYGSSYHFVQKFDDKAYPFLIEEDEGAEAGK